VMAPKCLTRSQVFVRKCRLWPSGNRRSGEDQARVGVLSLHVGHGTEASITLSR
jgi:hypothetical protein